MGYDDMIFQVSSLVPSLTAYISLSIFDQLFHLPNLTAAQGMTDSTRAQRRPLLGVKCLLERTRNDQEPM